MNSMSKNCASKHFEDECCEHRTKKITPAFVRCSNPGSVTIPAVTAAGTTFTVSSLTLNTSCLCNPCIKFEFASNIITTAAVLSINFQIFKLCNNQFTPVPVGPTWTFSRAVAVTDANTFSFDVCECCGDICPNECCTYTVVVTVTGLATAGVTAINNATLSAIVTDGTNPCC